MPTDIPNELADLPVEVFQLTDRGLTVESLTAAHGMAENEASFPCTTSFCSVTSSSSSSS